MTIPSQNNIDPEITSITNQLVDKFKADKVILFGSAANGKFGHHSDLDFLVVKNDSRRPLEVEQELHRLINYNLATDFIFLSGQDYNDRLKRGDFFLAEIMSTGKVLYG